MKILHLIYTEAVAGAEKYLMNLLPGLKSFGIDCHLVCVTGSKTADMLKGYSQEMQNRGIKASLLIGTKKDFFFISKSIKKYLIKEDISIIHSHLSNADLLAVLVKKLSAEKIWILSTKHGYDEKYLVKYSADANKNQIDRNLYYYYTKWLLYNIDINIATSKGMADLYYNIGLTSKHFNYIHHGLPAIPLPVKIKDPNIIQLIIVGRLEKVKGHTYLLQAFRQVVKIYSTANLMILGDGTEKQDLIKQSEVLGIQKNVTFLNYQNDPYKLMANADMIVQPSLFESFGLVFIEGFALKIPVIAFDVPAANEIITNGVTGLLIPKFDYEDLADKIIYLIKNAEVRNNIAENAYKRYINNYTAERMIKETAEWYRSLGI